MKWWKQTPLQERHGASNWIAGGDSFFGIDHFEFLFKLRQRFTSDTEQGDYIPTKPSTTQQLRLEEEKNMIETNLFIAGSYPDSYNWLPWEYQVAAAVGGIWVLGATDENLDCFVDALIRGLGNLYKGRRRNLRVVILANFLNASQFPFQSVGGKVMRM